MQKLKTVDADTLLSTPLPANQFVVERLLPQGLHILAGASKVGKSWLALWLCLCVAKGEPVWGLTTVRGTVLYLCLEDSLSRIQGRLFQLTENAPAALHFATMAGNIGKGLEEQKQEPVSPEVLRLAEFLKSLESFDGTATEPAMLWEGYAGEPVQPSVLSKKLARYAGELDKLGVHITTSRTRESRSLHLRHCEGLCARSAHRAGETPSQAMQRPFGRFVPGVEHPGIYSRFGAICAGRYVSRIKR